MGEVLERRASAVGLVTLLLGLATTVGLVMHLMVKGGSSAPHPPAAAASPPPPSGSKLLPDYRLKWLVPGAKAVSVSGDWNKWSVPGVPMARDEDNVWAADIFLPTRCPRKNLILTGVCCYRYKFYIDTGVRQRWLHDPRQPMDKDPDGWVNNFMCKYASGDDGRPLPMLLPTMAGQGNGKSRGGKGRASGDGATAAGQDGTAPLSHAGAAKAARQAAVAAAVARDSAVADSTGLMLPPPPPPVEVCAVLPATYLNGTPIGSTSTRGLGGCCEACRRRRGCVAYNWRPEPLPRNCVFFGSEFGSPRGTALSSAGLVRVPLAGASPQSLLSPPSPSPHRKPKGKKGHRKPKSKKPKNIRGSAASTP